MAVLTVGLLLPAAPRRALDVPASGQAAGEVPLPLDELRAPAESAALPAAPLPEAPAAPVFTATSYHTSGNIYYKNETAYAVDPSALLTRPCPVELGKEGVQVLIMHTHGTEAYTPSPAHPYEASGEYRTTDPNANLLRVGQEVCDILNQAGISTVHSTTLNDYPAYNGSYNRALKDIEAYVAQHPTIRLVIDLHRDAISSNGVYYKTSAEVEGQPTAQLMFVTGTDEGGLKHPDWRENLTFQAQLHHRLNGACPGIMRPMSIRSGRFNQHVRPGSMLVEVGSCGNTLEEALAAARIFAETLAEMLKE